MSDRMLYIGGGIAVTAALALAIYLRPLPEGAQEPAPAEVAAVPDAGADPSPAEAVATESEPTPAPEAMPPLSAPRLTDLRVEPDGMTVISGLSAPRAEVTLFLDGVEIDRVTADDGGAFLAFPVLSPSQTPRLLTLTARLGEETRNGDVTFAVAPFGVAPDAIVAAVTPQDDPVAGTPQSDPGAETVAAPEAVETPDEATEVVAPAEPGDPETVETAAPDLTNAEPAAPEAVVQTPAAPPILAISEEGVQVLNAPSDKSPEAMSSVALDTITYDGTGDVLLAGRAANTGFLRVYVDNSPVTALAVDAASGWEVTLPEVDTGVYTLRIDEVSAEGEVLSRIETPFLREDPALVEEAFEQAPEQNAGLSVAMRTVQPGNTLWAIAEERYGAGILYVQVFEANADRIRNPDLIYPGQVFELPELGQ